MQIAILLATHQSRTCKQRTAELCKALSAPVGFAHAAPSLKMKLDVNTLRYLNKDDFRVLTAVEMGQKNHEIVPCSLIDSIAGLKHGGTFKCLKNLLRNKLVHHDNSKYDGYRLTYMGYDFLAIKALVNRGAIAGVGRQIGVGKESDIFEVMNEDGEVMALKLHRLGRTSFRAVKSKRDYLRKGSHFSWLYLSRLAALKEFAFMRALGQHGLPVPQAIDHNRHAVLMTMLDAHPLVQVRELANPRAVYAQLMGMLSRLAGLGLVHCDYNEFNLLVNDKEEITLIDFPQMVSVSHANAEELFDRDVECIIRFFSKKLGYVPEEELRPSFREAVQGGGEERIDEEVRASGFKREYQDALDRFVTSQDSGSGSEEGSEEDSDEDEEEEGSEDVEAGSGGGGGGEAASGGKAEGEAAEGSGSDEEALSSDDAGSSHGSEEGLRGEEARQGSAGSPAQGGRPAASDGDAEEEVEDEQQGPEQLRSARAVAAGAAAKLSEESRRAGRRAALARASRNAAKPKNRGQRRGAADASGW